MKAILLVLATISCASASSAPAPARNTGPASITETETGNFVRLNEESGGTTAIVAASPDRVWALLPEVYQELEIAGDVLDASTRTFGIRSYTQSRLAGKRTAELVRCGNQGAGPSASGAYRTRLSITTTVQPEAADRTRLTTEVSGSATSVEGTSTGAVRCVSTGELEQRIRKLLLQRLSS